MKSQTLKILTLCLAVVLVSFACGGGEGKNMETQSAAEPSEKRAEQEAEMTPTEVGQQIGELYIRTMTELVELLEEKPEVSEVRAKVESLKEDCVTKMIDLGKKREALDEPGRSTVDSHIRMEVSSLYSDPVFTGFNEIQQHYFKNQDFHKLVMSFNIITQYANFELLKKQEPEEAQRLGIQ